MCINFFNFNFFVGIERSEQVTHPEVTEEFTQIELKRLKAGLSREVAKIKYPKRSVIIKKLKSTCYKLRLCYR